MNRKKKNNGSVFLLTAFCTMLAITNSISVQAYETEEAEIQIEAYTEATGITVEYHTIDEIRAYVSENGPVFLGAFYTTKPDTVNAPYAPGQLTDEVLNDALKAVNTVRYIAGLDSVTLSSYYTEMIQAGCLINAVNNSMSHTPAQPEGMDDDLYALGYKGTSSSNLGMGYGSLAYAVTGGWLKDDSSSNINSVGHRRWLLNAAMKQTGFGQVNKMTGMYAFDRTGGSKKTSNVWPAQNTPLEYFDSEYPWSVSTGAYEDISTVKVTMTNVETGTVYSFSQDTEDGYFNVNNGGYGTAGAIIWRPDSISYESGDTYNVDITGLKNGDISYSVHFFNIFEEEETMEMDPAYLELEVGESGTAYAVFRPIGFPDYIASTSTIYSSEKQISVDITGSSLIITANETGRAVVFVYSKNGKSARVVVDVTEHVEHVTGVTVTPAALEIGAGESAQLSVEVTPENADNKTVSWNSSDSNIASVDQNGLVTGKKPGTVTIEATTEDGNYTASCEVTVIEKEHIYSEPVYTWSEDYLTCTAEGICSICGESITETVNSSYEVTKEPTCSEEGTGTYTAVFENELFETQIHVIEIEPTYVHIGEEVEYTWSEDYSLVTATAICILCGEELTEEVVPAKEVIKEPTCSEAGMIRYTAEFVEPTFTTQIKEVEIPATGEHEGIPEYTWAADYGTVTASLTCEVCGELISETVNTTYEVIEKPSKTEEGIGRYTAVFTNTLFTTQTMDVTIPILETILPASVKLNKNKTAIVYGKTEQLTAVIEPDDAEDQSLTWTCSDENAVTVTDNGLIKGIKPGKATVTVTTVNGLSDTCEVRVMFEDVTDNTRYFYNPVYWAVDNDVTTGTRINLFSPNDNVKREQVVTFLWRAAGSPKPESTAAFVDLKEGAYYVDAVSWAAENGITTGYNDGTERFGVGDNCTREQIVTFLWRYAGMPEVSTQAEFTDTKEGAYYLEALSWAAENMITTGLNDGTGRFGVGQSCTRAMCVTFLYRYETSEK